MTLLAPLSALAAAAVCVPVLVLLYMLKLRRRPVRVSSTLLWRSAVDDLQANVPLRWLRSSWLLFLHLLILGLLVVAFGRPALSTSQGREARVVILLDRSASMNSTDEPGGATRWAAAQDRCVELIDRAIGAGGTSVALVTFAAEPSVLVGFATSAADLRDAVRATMPTDQPANLSAAFRAIEAMTAADGEESAERRPVVVQLVTDGSMETSGELAIGGAVVELVLIAPPRQSSGPDNLGIVAMAARRDYDDPSLTRVLVGVVNASETPRDIAVALSLDGRVVERRALRVPERNAPTPASGSAAPSASAPADAASVTFDLHATSGGVVTARLDRADVLEVDNSASLVLSAATRPRIVLVRPDDAPAITNDTTASTEAERASGTAAISPPWLLADALAELEASLRVISASEYGRLAESASLEADLVVFDRVMPATTPGMASLSFAAGLPIAGLVMNPTTITARTGSSGGTYVIAWSRTHPALRDVSLDSVYVAGNASITWPAGSPRFTALADGAAGTLIALVQEGPHRQLVVGFDPASSNWPLQPGFPIFLASAAEYLTQRGDEAAGRAFTTAQRVEVRAGARERMPGGRVELRGPVILTAVPRDELGESVPFGLIERAGLYAVAPAGRDAVIALNLLDRTESRLGLVTDLRVAGRTVRATSGSGVPREIWAWFVAAAAGLLLIEWMVYAARMRV